MQQLALKRSTTTWCLKINFIKYEKKIVPYLKYFANINVEDDDNVDRNWGGLGDPNAYGCFWNLKKKVISYMWLIC
jgi:hypothetical protein